MIRSLLARLRPETRAADLTAELLALRMAAAQGQTAADIRMTAAAEVCAGIWSRALASADSDRLSAAQLAQIGRDLVLRGNSVWLGASVAASFDITGSGQEPGPWIYRLSVPSPTGTRSVVANGVGVAHYRVGSTRESPWLGRSVFDLAAQSCALAARLESSLAAEEGGPVGHIMPVPDVSAASGIADQLPQLGGRTVLGETMSAGWDGGRGKAPSASDWRPIRLGPEPPREQVELRRHVAASLYAAAGVPPELADIPATGTDRREAWRQFISATVAPVGRMIGDEVRRVYGGSGVVDFRAILATDLQSRARAYKQLTDAGMEASRAADIAGF
ncbi:MAG: hypothetical protein OXI45_13650 [Acidobacteriota bacterium]|nr:hypothetical protein [Acidobacteriota bacterium]